MNADQFGERIGEFSIDALRGFIADRNRRSVAGELQTDEVDNGVTQPRDPVGPGARFLGRFSAVVDTEGAFILTPGQHMNPHIGERGVEALPAIFKGIVNQHDHLALAGRQRQHAFVLKRLSNRLIPRLAKGRKAEVQISRVPVSPFQKILKVSHLLKLLKLAVLIQLGLCGVTRGS